MRRSTVPLVVAVLNVALGGQARARGSLSTSPDDAVEASEGVEGADGDGADAAGTATQESSPSHDAVPKNPRMHRLYHHDAIGIGGWFASSIFEGTASDGSPGTRDVKAMTIALITTLAYRVRPGLAIGAQLQVNFFPYVKATEDRGLGYRQLVGSNIGVSGLLGPSVTMMRARLRLDISAGFLFVAVKAENRLPTEPAFGGVGAGLSIAGGYDIPLKFRRALTLDIRVTSGAHFWKPDPTHRVGWDFAPMFLVGYRWY